MARAGYTIVGNRVAQARLTVLREDGKPLSQQDLADRCRLHRVTIAKIESGNPTVSLETLEQLAHELGRTREWLQGEPDEVDAFEAARERLATAMSKMAEGFEDFSLAVEVLEERAKLAGAREAVEA